jgi:hypothetical protein
MDYMYPSILTMLMQCLHQLLKSQNPPYSRGVYFVDIRKTFVTYKASHKWIYRECAEPIWTKAVKNGVFFVNKAFTRYSSIRLNESYGTYMEHLAAKFPGYILKGETMFNFSDVAVNLDELLDLLKSRDLEKYEKVKDRFFGDQTRFVSSGTNRNHRMLSLATYPRSGNSMMRTIFGKITGIATGSDMVMKHGPNLSLQCTGLKGEGVVDERVWITKTHYPMTFPF